MQYRPTMVKHWAGAVGRLLTEDWMDERLDVTPLRSVVGKEVGSALTVVWTAEIATIATWTAGSARVVVWTAESVMIEIWTAEASE